jgi:spermidine synthase
MSDVIYPPGRHPLRDPRARVHVEDGRYFLETTTERYDLITGEPPPPRTPGASNIYTREYFRLIHERLNEGGVTTYWLPVGRPNPGTDVDTIVKAFCEVFEDCALWNATPFDFMLTGSRSGGGAITAGQLSAPWQNPALLASLREIGFERPEQIGATFLGDAAYLRQLTASRPPLIDDFPQRLEPVPARPSLSDPGYGTSETVRRHYQDVLDPSRAASAFAASPFIRRLWPAPLIAATAPFFEIQRLTNDVLWDGSRPLAHIDGLHRLLTTTTLRTLPLWYLGSDDVRQRIAEGAPPENPMADYARGLRALSGRDYRSASALFVRAANRGVGGTRPLLAYSLAMSGRMAEARQVAESANPATEDERQFWRWMESGPLNLEGRAQK